MGLPEWVDSAHHHKPSDVQSLAERAGDIPLIITHTFVDQPGVHPIPTVTDVYPNHPNNVHHAEDGLRVVLGTDGWEF